MAFKYSVIPMALVAALALSATPASAQHARGHVGGFREHGRFAHRSVARFHDGRFGHPFVGVRVIRPFYRPYFAFRPRFGLGFGLFVGWPVPYPWDYVAVYPDAYTYPGYVDEGTPYAGADQHNYGGLSFAITPADATVVVDGTTVGTVQMFSASSAPLTLEPGRHQVVVEKRGYHSMTFDANVVAGQVLPYQGTMQRQ